MYKTNLEALKKRYPNYARIIDAAYISKDYEIEKTDTPWPTLKYKGQYWYDKSNPPQDCANNLVSFEVRYCRLAVFLGFGLGYDAVFYTERLSQQYLTDNLIVIEKDPALIKLAMRYTNLAPFFSHDRIQLVLTDDIDDLFDSLTKYLMQEQRYYFLRSLNYFYNMMQFEQNKDFYVSVMDTFRRAASYVLMYFGNDAKDSHVGYRNMFANLDEIINNPGINMLNDKFKGIPAVCVATGPSLDKNMHLLKGLENKALIIAADASLKPMLEKGLKPHMVTSLEREMAIVDLFKGIPSEQYDDVYLCGCPVLYNEVYQTYAGPRIIVYRAFDHFKWLGIDRGLLEIKLSSGNMNFKIAEYLGCDPIILIGQDLALDGNKTNADGAVLGTEQESYLNEPRMMVRGNFVSRIETTRSLNMMLEAFAVDVAGYAGKCINATEGGAYIPKTKLMSLEAAIKQYITTPAGIKERLDAELGKFVPDLKDRERVRDKAVKSIESFRTSLAICEEALELTRTEHADVKAAFVKMYQLRSQMQEDNFTWQLYFAHLAQTLFVNHEIYLNSIKRDEPDEIKAVTKAIKESERFFKGLRGLIKICIEDLEEIANV